MLLKAKEKIANEHFDITFQQADARDFELDQNFKLIIMLCEDGFSLMETDEMNFQILKNAAKHLKRGGNLFLYVLTL